MANDTSITNEIERLGRLQEVAETYKILAATGSRRIRSSVLTNRSFYEGLHAIFSEIVAAYRAEVEKLRLREKRKKAASRSAGRNGKTVLVLLSANTGLYGEILLRVMNEFVREAKTSDADLVVIGKRGRFFFEEALPGHAYTYYDFPDSRIAYQDVQPVVAGLSRYERVLVFHGQFKNRLLQDVRISEASGTALLGEDRGHDSRQDPAVRYNFEPSLAIIFSFFETEIFAAFVEQIFHESQLAKLVSRVVLLDRTSSRIKDELSSMQFSQRRLYHQAINKKQLDAMSGVSLWNRTH